MKEILHCNQQTRTPKTWETRLPRHQTLPICSGSAGANYCNYCLLWTVTALWGVKGRCTGAGHGMQNFWAFFLFCRNEINNKGFCFVRRAMKLVWADSEHFKGLTSGQPELHRNTATSPPGIKQIKTFYLAHIWTARATPKHSCISSRSWVYRKCTIAHIWPTRATEKHSYLSTRSRAKT